MLSGNCKRRKRKRKLETESGKRKWSSQVADIRIGGLNDHPNHASPVQSSVDARAAI